MRIYFYLSQSQRKSLGVNAIDSADKTRRRAAV